MPSFRSKLFVFVLKYRHLLQGKLKRTTKIDDNTSLINLRKEVEKGADFFGKLPEGFQLDAFKIGDLEAEWMIPPDAPDDKAILYFHGGGLVCGSIRAHRAIVSKFVKGTGIKALVINYALAPEHPFPEGLNDAVAAYEYMLDQGIPSSQIIFMGDSGGGNLVLATMLALKDKNIPLPGGAVALSPWTDLTNSLPSLKDNAKVDTLCWKEAQTVFSKYYTGEHDPSDPLISPLFGDLKGLPPTLLYVGGDELMRDDSVQFAEKAEAAGVDVTLHVGKGMFHCYPACAPLFPEATQGMEEICEFVKKINE